MPIFKKKHRQLQPARILVIGFALVVVLGTILLLLPVSAREGKKIQVIEAFFTAMTATCVTGITLVDIYNSFSLFGHTVIIVLMQIGGIGLLTLVTFFNELIGRKLGLLRTSSIVREHTDDFLSGAKRVFGDIIKYSFAIEGAGALLFMFVFIPRHGIYGAFMAVFTAVSAFCNSGLDLLGIEGIMNPFANYADDVLFAGVISALVILGGFGYVVLRNLAGFIKYRKLSLHTKVVLITSGILIVFGFIIYFIVMSTNPVYTDYPLNERVIEAALTSVSARTAGFHGIGVQSSNDFAQIFSMLLMFIGGAPASTAGGIKVTTLAITIATFWSVIKGREDTLLLGHRVKKEVVYKTLTVLSLSLIFIMSAFTIIYFSNDGVSEVNLLFEVVSAYTTTGFSNGTALLINDFSKVILALTMFIGRIGPVSLIISLTLNKKESGSKIVPESEIMVG